MKRKYVTQDPIDRINALKRLTIMGLFSDDTLAELLVLKGGNALSLIYRLGHRGSLDLDFSIEGDFPLEVRSNLETRIGSALNKAFEPEGYVVFDVTIDEVPRGITADLVDFWGGYAITFKLIPASDYHAASGNLDVLRRRSLVTDLAQGRKVKIEISKHEYCGGSELRQLDGLSISIYSPAMIVCEKLRAICQQMDDYCQVVKRKPRARARDFFDIHATIKEFRVDLADPETQTLLRAIFAAKRVPLNLLSQIGQTRAFHSPDFDALKDTVPAGTDLLPFDYYFDFVAGLCASLESFGVIDAPSL